MPEGINGWLILNIALGVFVGGTLLHLMAVRWPSGVRGFVPTAAVTSAAVQTTAPITDPIETKATEAPESWGWGSKVDWEKLKELEENEDWEFLWSNIPDSAKEEVRSALEDAELRRRTQAADLWPHLWHAAPEMVKTQLRHRWKEFLKIRPRWTSQADYDEGGNLKASNLPNVK